MTDNRLSDEDRALFRNFLKKPGIIPCKDGTSGEAARPGVSLARAVTLLLSSHYLETVGPETILMWHAQDFPSRRLRELRQGLIHYQMCLDLHGLQMDGARQKLLETIDEACLKGVRCLLVVHGKGGRTADAPVLKNLVNHWLKQIPHILAFHSAPPRSGGAGAVLVLLRNTADS
ncbi:DNA mismatch repair protein-like protein [Legionella geestiana]|uniref:DNA mismatch repair protein-like protein n=1 Tax=Legionella geestiana TaxID=45065 RepID=A0A0W0U1M6_9GAMM|nr:Smr/MutS family protein [Legionella geestiana]KTD01982.1 DNA mismatch repair protein-like protein [Legionella geestiana]QBS12026.1 DNA mismatch repair protein MutS [Legionella geestiana]QDQ40364.1 DNA mismatch repair protein MutS [Legionella geestiana]STX53255.1 Smr domain protein, DNA mismatch repair protein-like protein [Legionella geestiana]